MVNAYICYSALDSSLVHEVVESLAQSRCCKCFLPARDIPIGSSWSRSIDTEIKKSDVFVIIYTNNFNNSYIVVDELYKASCYNKRVVIYCVDSIPFRSDKWCLEEAYKVPFSALDHKTLVNALINETIIVFTRVKDVSTGYCSGYHEEQKITSHPRLAKQKDNIFKRIISRLFNSYQQVNSAIYAPAEVLYDEYMLVQVYIYRDGEESMVEMKAKAIDCDAIIRNYEPLHMSLKRGDKIRIQYDNEFYSEAKTIEWYGGLGKTDFYFKVSYHYSFYSSIKIFINDVPVGEMMFKTKVLTNPDKKLNAEIDCVKYNRIFISYAHLDASKIQYFAEAYKASGTQFFYDRDSLSPGDIYQDKIFEYIDSAELFILCWSKNSSLSEWCCLEKERALYNTRVRKTFRIYPVSIDPKASLPSDMTSKYHFGEI